MSDDRINEIDVQLQKEADNLSAPLDLGNNIRTGNFAQPIPEGPKSSKGYKYLMIFSIVLIVFDVLGFFLGGYSYLKKNTNLFSGFNIYSGNWVSYDQNGAYVWKFSGSNCSIDYVEPGGSTTTLFTDIPFYGSRDHITVNFAEESSDLYYDSEFNCLWEYKYDGDVETRTKLLFFKNYPTAEQNERNIKGYSYLCYNTNDYSPSIIETSSGTKQKSYTSSVEQYPTFSKNDFYEIVNDAHDDLEWLYYRLEREGRIDKTDFFYENPEEKYGEWYASDITNTGELKSYLLGLKVYDSAFIDKFFLSDADRDWHFGSWTEYNGKLYFGYNWGMGWYPYDENYLDIEDNGNGKYTVKGIAIPIEINDENYNELISEGYQETYTLETRNGRLVITGYYSQY